MRYGSVCSGIEAATVAWHSLKWDPVWFSEIEPFPCKVLAHHYPSVPNLGNMLHLSENEIFNNEPIDLLVGGTPCQSFSIAGLRAGLSDSRGNLTLEYCRILRTKRPKWFVWENVPGVLSSSKGQDFASILSGFQECGYSFAWRILDAQYFGVPQRRRRVFVVGHLGNDWRPPAAVLFEPQGLRRNFTQRRKERSIVAALTKNGVGASGADDNQAQAEHIIAKPLNASTYRDDYDSENFVTHAFAQNSRNELRFTGDNKIGALSAQPGMKQQSYLLQATPINTQIATRGGKMGDRTGFATPGTIENSTTSIIQNDAIVRRLTPMECERLQGFPDQYTGLKGAKNSPRYAAIGNSMAVPVMAWIGRRVDHVDKQIHSPLQS